MFEFFLGMIVCLPFAFFIGYGLSKYVYAKSELFDNINKIKEDLNNLQIQFSVYCDKKE